MFENDVNQYGYLTIGFMYHDGKRFENDVNQYGYLTLSCISTRHHGLRMM